MGIMKAIILLFLSVYAISSVACTGRSKIRLGHEFINGAADFTVTKLFEEFNKKKSTLTHTEIKLSHLKVNLTHINFSSVDLRAHELEINYGTSDNSIQVRIKNMNFTLSADYRRKLFFCENEGHLVADVNINIVLAIRMKAADNSALIIELKEFDFNYDKTKIDIQGGFIDEILEVGIKLFHFLVNWIVESSVKDKINSSLKTLNANLYQGIKFPDFVKNMTVKLSENPVVTKDYYQMEIETTFVEKKPKKFLSYIETEEDSTVAGAKDISKQFLLNINNELLNMVFEQFHLGHLIKFNFNNTMLPKSFPFKLNTYYFEKAVPELFKLYPNKDLILDVKSTKKPVVKLGALKEQVTLNANMLIEFALFEEPGKTIFSLDTDTTIGLILDAKKEDSKLHFQLSQVKVNDIEMIVQLKGVDVKKLKDNLNLLFGIGIFAANKMYLSNGVPLPAMKGLTYESVAANVTDDYLVLKMQPHFNFN